MIRVHLCRTCATSETLRTLADHAMRGHETETVELHYRRRGSDEFQWSTAWGRV